jgi:L-threonylcarbamoyladenylate synthase
VLYWGQEEIKMPNKLILPLKKQVEQAILILKEGGIVAFPTDTVYGLGAAANLPQAVARVYQVKKRPKDMPLPLLLADKSQIGDVAEPVPPLAWLLAAKFLPGALTMVLPRSKAVPDTVSDTKTVAVRVPAHPIPIVIIQGLGKPIVGTSANLSGKPSALTAEDVNAQLDGRVDLIIDGGRCPGGRESTVVDLTGATPKILREGAISKEELSDVYRRWR